MNMKKHFTLLLLAALLCNNSAWAGRISEQQAWQHAVNFLQGENAGHPSGPRRLKSKALTLHECNYYVFNAEEQDSGFVIVAADDQVPIILGYALHGTFNLSTIPSNLRWLLDYYDSCIGSLSDESTEASVSSNSVQRADISPLITTQWGQGSPYNALCPKFQGETCKIGCVATSMAQIINFHRWPQAQTSSVNAYVSSSHQISMPELPPMQFNWEGMSETEAARLMLYCGQSVQMDYDPNESRANPDQMVMALTKVFGYSRSTSFIDREDYDEDEWEDIIYQELSEGRPLVYNGSCSEGLASFIVSGYKDQLFHMNWGRSGDYDGYYALTGLTPTNRVDNSAYQTAVIGIQPSAGTIDSDRPKVVVKGMTANERRIYRFNLSEGFANLVDISCTVVSDLYEEGTFELGIGLYDANGLQKVLSATSNTFSDSESYTYESLISLSSEIPLGEYTIKAIHRLKDEDPWSCDAASNNCYIKLTISESCATIRVRPKAGDDKYKIEFGNHTIDGVTYRLVCEYGNNHAYILRYNEAGRYKGDVFVPDQIEYNNMTFHVFGMEDFELPFWDCPELTSLSIGVTASIYRCPQLKNLEIRQSVSKFGVISECNALETLTYPMNMILLELPSLCKNLKSITFSTDKQVKVWNVYNETDKWNSLNMPSLTDVYFHSDVPMFFDDTTKGDLIVNPKVTIHIPQDTLPVYEQTQWKNWNLMDDLPPMPTCVKWDYCGNKWSNGCFDGLGIGRGDNDVEAAMCVPASLIAPYKGCKVTKIEFYTGIVTDNDWHFDDVEYVFLTKPGTDYLIKEPLSVVRGTWQTVELHDSYVITGDSLFVGIGRNKALGFAWASYGEVDDGFYLRVMGDDDSDGMADEVGVWQKHAGNTDYNRALPIRFYIEGENLPTDVLISKTSLTNQPVEQNILSTPALRIAPPVELLSSSAQQQSADDAYFIVSKGKPETSSTKAPRHILREVSDSHLQLQVDVRSRTVEPIRSLTFNWAIDNQILGSQSFETYLIPNHEGTFCIDLPAITGGRSHRVVVEVAEINGIPDEINANSSDTTLLTFPVVTHYPRRVVMEEITASWCGWCPRYIDTIKEYSTQYPDNFIAISIHSGDMMYPIGNGYDPFYAMFSSVPGSLINRTRKFEPDIDYLQDIMEEMKDLADATIEATAYFVAQDSSRVAVTTQTTFGFSDNGSTEYRIAYVVLEDQVGPYYQTNNYSDPEAEDDPDDRLNFWRHSDPYVLTTFDDVARAILPDWQGAAGYVPAVINEGETYSHTYELTLPENIQQKKNLRIVTLLIDGTTGEIMNAAQTPVIYDAEVDVEERHAGRQSFDVYSLAGTVVRRQAASLRGLGKGVYIMAGKKIVVR